MFSSLRGAEQEERRTMPQMTEKLRVKKGASLSTDPVVAARELAAAIYDPEMALGVVYCSPDFDLLTLGRALHEQFRGANLIGCTSAGEITPVGYVTGALTGVSVTSSAFTALTRRIDGLSTFEIDRGRQASQSMLGALKAAGKRPTARNTFGFLLIDGLSMQEEAVVSAIHRDLGDIQLFGGSAGDGLAFRQTYVYHEGEFRKDCAALTLVHTELPFTVFKTEHFVSGTEKMVVTGADPTRRVVNEINGEPAAREYARVVGVDPAELTPMIFSAHPVVVKVGGKTYVRSIQKVNPDQSLTFYCAIDEGIVLTIAQGVDYLENLEQLFTSVREKVGQPRLILGCDCILRSLEADQKGLKPRLSELMAANNVIGFATYGEQFNAMHVNQTFTGVAIGD
jgi:hypothetical protein